MTVHILHPQETCFNPCFLEFIPELQLSVEQSKAQESFSFKKPKLILKKRKRKQKVTVLVERKRTKLKRSIDLLVTKKQMKEALLAKAVTLEKSVLKQSGPVVLYKAFYEQCSHGCPLCEKHVDNLPLKIERDVESLRNIMKKGDAYKEKKLLAEQLENELIPNHLCKSEDIFDVSETNKIEEEQRKHVNAGMKDALGMIKRVLVKSKQCALCESKVDEVSFQKVVSGIERRMAKLID